MKLKNGFSGIHKTVEFLKQNKLVLIILATGLLFLLLPTERDVKPASSQEISGEDDDSITELQQELGEILSRIDGAGKVSVMLTIRSGTERIFAVDRETEERDGTVELREEIVVVSGDSGENAVLIGQNYPTFQGALVVCPGGGDPEIQLALTRALSALTGLSANRIMVCKGS